MTEVSGKAGARFGGEHARKRAAGKRTQRQHNEHSAGSHDLLHIDAALNFIDKAGGNEGNERFDDSLADDQGERQDRGRLVFPHARSQTF